MNDAERLMANYIPAVSTSPYAIAPERAEDLNDTVFGKVPWTIDFTMGPTNFVAYPDKQLIEARFSALLSLWAAANAALTFADVMTKAVRTGMRDVDTAPGSPGNQALRLVNASKELIRDPHYRWPAALPVPDAHPSAGQHLWYVNQLFLAATSWVLLHEVAHVHLSHEQTTTSEIRVRQEFEADDWATRWILEKAPEDLRREFRSLGCATGLAWVGLVDEVRRGGTQHPHASQRLTACSGYFPSAELSPALEMATHIVKAFFNPHEKVPDSEHAADAFDQILHWYRDVSR
jgi:hypothetical protein